MYMSGDFVQLFQLTYKFAQFVYERVNADISKNCLVC